MTKWRSEWLDWHPPQDSFVGFEGSIQGEAPIIQTLEAAETGSERHSKGRIIEKADRTVPTKPTKPIAEKIPPMPRDVKLIAWNPKRPPVAISYCAVVNDVESFIADTLAQLDRALRSSQGAATHRKLRELVDRLEQCGVVVKVAGVGSASGGRP